MGVPPAPRSLEQALHQDCKALQSNAHLKDVSRRLQLFRLPQSAVIGKSGILLPLGQLVPNHCCCLYLVMVDIPRVVGHQKGLATRGEVIWAEAQELEDSYHLLQLTRHDRRVGICR
jgi:hypothetical protein